MKKIILTAAILLMALLCVCSCKKAENKNTAADNTSKQGKTLDDLQGSAMADADKYREQGAAASGKRLNEKIKEKEKAEKEGKNSKSDSAEEKNKTENNDGKASESSANTAGEKLTGTKKENVTDLRKIIKGEHADALTDEELSRTVNLALTYAARKYGKKLKAGDLMAVNEKSGIYDKYPLYDKGNIIIYTFGTGDDAQNIVIARAGHKSAWKVLEKKK